MGLGQWNDAYKEATTEGFGDLPDGSYRVIVDEVELKKTKKTNADMLTWKLKVAGDEGAYAGRIIFHNRVIASAENAGFLKKELVCCGMVIDDLDTLQSRLGELLDLVLDIQIKTRSKDGQSYTNIFFNKLVESADGLPF